MNELLWFVSRATGVASIVLLTIVLVLGLVTSGRRSPHSESVIGSYVTRPMSCR